MSGGHLCKAEAPTEPAGETAVRRAAIRSPSPSSLRTPSGVWQSVSLLKGNTDSFAPSAQNDRVIVIAVRVSGGHLCKAEAPTEPAGETAVRCVAIRSLFICITDYSAASFGTAI